MSPSERLSSRVKNNCGASVSRTFPSLRGTFTRLLVRKVHSYKHLQGQFTKSSVLKVYLQHTPHQTAGFDSSLLVCVCLEALAAWHNKEKVILRGDCTQPRECLIVLQTQQC